MAKQTLTPAEVAAVRTMGRSGLDGLGSPRNADVFIRYFGLLNHPRETLATIGLRHNLSKERVRQLVARVRTKLGYVPEAAP